MSLAVGTMGRMWFCSLLIAPGCVALLWSIITIWVDLSVPGTAWTVGHTSSERAARIVFDRAPHPQPR